MSSKDCLKVLGLDSNKKYTENEIKKAYRKLSKLGDKRVDEAYKTLKQDNFGIEKEETFIDYLRSEREKYNKKYNIKNDKRNKEERVYRKDKLDKEDSLTVLYLYTKLIDYIKLIDDSKKVEYTNVLYLLNSYLNNELHINDSIDIVIKNLYIQLDRTCNDDVRFLHEIVRSYDTKFANRLSNDYYKILNSKPYLYNPNELRENITNPSLSFAKYLEVIRNSYYAESKDLDLEYDFNIYNTKEYDTFKKISLKTVINRDNISIYKYLYELSLYYVNYINPDKEVIAKNIILKNAINDFLEPSYKKYSYLHDTKEDFERTFLFDSIYNSIDNKDEDSIRYGISSMEYITNGNNYEKNIIKELKKR